MPLPFYWRKPVHTFPAVTGDLLVRLYQSLVTEVKKMSQSTDEIKALVQGRLDTLVTDVAAAGADLAGLRKQVADLQAQVAAGTGPTVADFQPLLDKFDAQTKALEAAVATPAEPPASA